jgi:restriction system protein
MAGTDAFTGFSFQFTGREAELLRIDSWLQKNATKKDAVIIKVIGPANTGKTAVVREALKSRSDAERVHWANLRNKDHTATRFIRAMDIWKQWFHRWYVVLDAAEETTSADLHDWVSAIRSYKAVRALFITSRSTIPVGGHLIRLGAGLRTDVRESRELLFHILGEHAHQLGEQRIDKFLLHALAGHSLEMCSVADVIAKLLKEFGLTAISTQVFGIEAAEQSRIIQIVQPQIITLSGQLVEQLKRFPEMLHTINSRQFEEVVADIFSDMGWQVELTRATRDGGVDIFAHLNTGVIKFLCLIEAKKYNRMRPVGVHFVRELYGTLRDKEANSAILVTTSHFSKDAREFESRHKYQMSLKDCVDVIGWLAKYKGSSRMSVPSEKQIIRANV